MSTTVDAELSLADVVLDFTYYPRHQVDQEHVLDLVGALKAGDELPPIVVERKTLRVVDGFHRVRANRMLRGENAKIRVDWRTFANDREFFLASIEANAKHGRKLFAADVERIQAIGRGQLHVDQDAIAGALHTSPSKLALHRPRTAVTSPVRPVLARPAAASAATRRPVTPVDPEQVVGAQFGYYAEQLIGALENRRVQLKTPGVSRATLVKLHYLLGKFLG